MNKIGMICILVLMPPMLMSGCDHQETSKYFESVVRLTEEGLREGKVKNNLHVAADGVEALAFLRREGPYAGMPLPDLILLDLNLPQKKRPRSAI